MKGRIGVSRNINAKMRANLAEIGKPKELAGGLRELRKRTLASMTELLKCETEEYRFKGSRGGRFADVHRHIQRCAVSGGSPAALKTALSESDTLIAQAIALDPRLARRSEWTRGEDGIFADAGLVASGDDSPCYDMTRAKLRDFAAAGEPVNVVVSTDAATPTSLAAFIATVRMVQQFRPVNVWWQGAWLNTDGGDYGYVFFAPLVTNDMDYSRVQYVLADGSRDWLSFAVLMVHARIRDGVGNLQEIGRHAERSYMDGARFVDKDGIKPDPRQVAATAARWLGWDSLYTLEYRADTDGKSALQTVPPETRPYVDRRTEDQKRRDREDSERWTRERKQADAAAAAKRMGAVG